MTRYAIWIAAAALALVPVASSDRLLAQQPPQAEQRAYTLQHTSTAEVEAQLRKLLSGIQGNPQIAVDRQQNRVFVRGSAEAQRLASQLISALDRPAAGGVQPTVQGTPVLRTYSVPAEKLEATATDLRRAYPAASGVRIATDKRSSQILVMAPPSIHGAIGQRLRQSNGARPKIAAGFAAEKQVDLGQPVRKTLKLRYIDPQQLHARINTLWGGRLPINVEKDGMSATVTLPAGGGWKMLLHIDRRSNTATLEGPQKLAESWTQVIRALDEPSGAAAQTIQLVSLKNAERDKVQQALAALRLRRLGATAGQAVGAVPLTGRAGAGWGGDLVSMIFQRPVAQNQNAAPAAQPPAAGQPAGVQPPPGVQPAPGGPPIVPVPDEEAGLIGPVQIEFLEGLDVIIIRGHKRDVERVMKIIDDIERLSAQTQPVVEVYRLREVDSKAMALVVNEVYEQTLATRHGPVSVTPLVKPNALLLIGREESVTVVKELLKKLDERVAPSSEFQVFQLLHMPVREAERIVNDFFDDETDPQAQGNRGGLGARVRTIADFRSNSLIVQAAPRDMAEVRRLLREMDVATIASVKEVRVFPLRNSLAAELAEMLTDAITGPAAAAAAPDGGPGGGATPGGGTQSQQFRSSILTFTAVDQDGQRLLKSGILADVTVTANEAANVVMVTGPSDSMDLIGALIKELDQLPPAEAQIKVFTMLNGDALGLAQTLEDMFDQADTQGQPALQTAALSGEGSLVPLTFAVDQRTNSIITSGALGDLNVVEAILLRLDESDIRQRETAVYRLMNSPADFVADAINEFLRAEQQRQQLAVQQQQAQFAVSPFEQIEREVVVVAEIVSNSLIISSTPRFFDQIQDIVKKLDRRPPMVSIQVLIADVVLTDEKQFGVEFGFQDKVLFDRGVILGTAIDPTEKNTGQNLGVQGITALDVGQSDSDLGFGGFVLNAGNESISILIRALEQQGRLQVLSRPHIMTLDNQPAFVQVGSRVRVAADANVADIGGSVSIGTEEENIGLILGVRPRISPDGLVVMEIDAERSRLGPEEEGTPIAVSANGTIIRSPQIETQLAQTTVSARSGQTVVLGGLISVDKATVSRKVPWISDIPFIGHAFRFDDIVEKRTELLIIMRPFIVEDEEDLERLKLTESARMSWCLADVVSLMGNIGLAGGHGWNDAETITVYPDGEPTMDPASDIPPLPNSEPVMPLSDRSRGIHPSLLTHPQAGNFRARMHPDSAPGLGPRRPATNLPPGQAPPFGSTVAPADYRTTIPDFPQFVPPRANPPLRLPPVQRAGHASPR